MDWISIKIVMNVAIVQFSCMSSSKVTGRTFPRYGCFELCHVPRALSVKLLGFFPDRHQKIKSKVLHVSTAYFLVQDSLKLQLPSCSVRFQGKPSKGDALHLYRIYAIIFSTLNFLLHFYAARTPLHGSKKT